MMESSASSSKVFFKEKAPEADTKPIKMLREDKPGGVSRKKQKYSRPQNSKRLLLLYRESLNFVKRGLLFCSLLRQ